MAADYNGINDFCYRAIMMAIRRINAGQGDPDTILRLVDQVVTFTKTGFLTRTQFTVIKNTLGIDIEVPVEPDPEVIPDEPEGETGETGDTVIPE